MQKIFHFILELFSWLKIIASTFIIGSIIGLIIYTNFDNKSGFIVAISFAIFGLIIGIIWATIIWKKQGTHFFLSKIFNTSEKKYSKKQN
ncbi:MAG: hypothetical protein ACOYMA_05420 [Bacteroidia bacterium]